MLSAPQKYGAIGDFMPALYMNMSLVPPNSLCPVYTSLS